MKTNNKIQEIFSKHRNINVGFEVECYYFGAKIDYDGVLDILHKIHPKIEIGGDGSLRPNKIDDYAIEIKTPVLPANQAIEVLNQVFNFINEYGYTNSFASVHLNFSPQSDKQYYRFNPVLFCNHPIWGTIGKYFGRNANRYCYNRFSDLKKLKSITQRLKLVNQSYDKYSGINLSHWTDNRINDSRIEVRLIGNKDFEKEFNRISYYTDKILTLFKKCSSRDMKPYKL